MATFSERLIELRKTRNLTQQELASYVNVNKQTISQYERGVRRPDFETLSSLCDYFNVSADYLLGIVNVTVRYVDSNDLAILDGLSSNLSKDEESLLHTYRALSKDGKENLVKFANSLLIVQKGEDFIKTTTEQPSREKIG